MCSQFRKSQINPHHALSPSTLAQHLRWPVNSPAAVVQNGTAEWQHSSTATTTAPALLPAGKETGVLQGSAISSFCLENIYPHLSDPRFGKAASKGCLAQHSPEGSQADEKRMCSSPDLGVKLLLPRLGMHSPALLPSDELQEDQGRRSSPHCWEFRRLSPT